MEYTPTEDLFELEAEYTPPEHVFALTASHPGNYDHGLAESQMARAQAEAERWRRQFQDESSDSARRLDEAMRSRRRTRSSLGDPLLSMKTERPVRKPPQHIAPTTGEHPLSDDSPSSPVFPIVVAVLAAATAIAAATLLLI